MNVDANATKLSLQAKTLVVNSVSVIHTLRKLTEIGYETVAVKKFLDDVSEAVAPHYHSHAVTVEMHVRKANPDMPEKELAATVKLTLEGYIADEVKYLKDNHDWKKETLPEVNDAALRKIYGCLDAGAEGAVDWSLLKNDTCSKCDKFRRAHKKAKAEKLKQGMQEAGHDLAGDRAKQASELGYGNVYLTPEIQQRMSLLMEILGKSCEADGNSTILAVDAFITKLGNIARCKDGVVASLAALQAKKAA